MRYSRIQLLIISCILFHIATTAPAYPSTRNFGRIRGASSKQNDRIYNKIAIDLVNGKTSNISIDNMSSLLKNYGIVQFDQALNTSARNMVIKEIAYRMIRSHYLPRVDDKIKVYRQSAELAKNAIPGGNGYISTYPLTGHGYKASLVVPIDYAIVSENRSIGTLRWPEISSQVSVAIENLWISRMQDLTSNPANQLEIKDLINVLNQLKLINDKEVIYSMESAPDVLKGNVLYETIEFIFQSWQLKGIVSGENLPTLAALLRQYIILNSSDSLDKLARDIRGFEDIHSLHNALLQRIYILSQDIKQNNPSDYAMLAMLQAMLSDISDRVSILSSESNTSYSNLKPRSLK
jgi:hypothetical protein